jgi:tetratricopeptide (TPR) repeat protein
MEIAEKIKSEGSKFGALHMLATSYEMQGKYEPAIALYQKGLDHYQSLGDKSMVAVETYNIASNKIKQRKLAEATGLLNTALATARQLNDEQFLPYIIFKYATIATVKKQHNKAARLYGSTDSLFKSFEMTFDPAEQHDWKHYTTLTKNVLGSKIYASLFAEGRLLDSKKALELISMN